MASGPRSITDGMIPVALLYRRGRKNHSRVSELCAQELITQTVNLTSRSAGKAVLRGLLDHNGTGYGSQFDPLEHDRKPGLFQRSGRPQDVLKRLAGPEYAGYLNFDYFSTNGSFAWNFWKNVRTRRPGRVTSVLVPKPFAAGGRGRLA